MSHFGDLMDGIPVKISERYIRPPKIEIPHSVLECGVRAKSVIENAKYCSTFEKNVLAKLKELKSAKETKKNERRHRLQLLEEVKQKKLDAIAAAEAEEKLKQLSVSDVSYPSTEEISEISPDDKTNKNCDTMLKQEEAQHTHPMTSTNNEMNYPTCSKAQEPPPNILQPIQVQALQQNNLLDDPDPLQEIKMKSKAIQVQQYNPAYSKHNIENLTYKDFEHDTSSPFDNVELKTINDMELLAQVLQNQRDSATACNMQPYVPDQSYLGLPNCASQVQIEGMSYLPNAYMEQPIQGPGMYTSPPNYIRNDYYVPTENCDTTVPMDNTNAYMPNYPYYVPSNMYTNNTFYNHYPTVTSRESEEIRQISNSSYIPQPYYFNPPPMPSQYQPNMYNTGLPNQTVESNDVPTTSTAKSRSRSVPDIVKELNEEVVSAKLRANERSYNASPSLKIASRPSSSIENKEKKSKKKTEALQNPYDKLSSQSQSMCKKIHAMGFPLDRVARMISLVGDSDKKVIEGLLLMGELMDLGFTEGKVAAALVRHEFNRDNALDELVS